MRLGLMVHTETDLVVEGLDYLALFHVGKHLDAHFNLIVQSIGKLLYHIGLAVAMRIMAPHKVRITRLQGVDRVLHENEDVCLRGNIRQQELADLTRTPSHVKQNST